MNRYLVWRDHYCYPDSDVLINRYDIREQTLLDQAERDVTALTIHTINLLLPFSRCVTFITACLTSFIAGRGRYAISLSAKERPAFASPLLFCVKRRNYVQNWRAKDGLSRLTMKLFVIRLPGITASSISCIPFGKETVGHYAFCSSISFFTQAIR
ncbi:hypothetical protein ABEG96_00170 [Pantoea agglomerans]